MKRTFLNIGKAGLGILLAGLVFLGILYISNDIGTRRSALESDIRSSQKISDDWALTGDVSDSMAAFIAYPEDGSDHTYSIYINRPGLSFGYFFREGGNLYTAESGIAQYTFDGCPDRAYISMNERKIERIEVDDGNSVRVIEVDPEKPFAIVLPVNAGSVTFFDRETP